MRGGKPSHGHAKGTCRNVVETQTVKKVDRCRISSVFTANTQLDLRIDPTPRFDGKLDELSYTAKIDGAKRVIGQVLFRKVGWNEFSLRIVSKKTRRSSG